MLKNLAKTIQTTFFRADDSIFRLGGEEFGVVFNTKDEASAILQADKLLYKAKENGRNKLEYITSQLH